MPLVKPNLDQPSIKDAVVLDLGDLGRQADQLKQKAKDHAVAITQQAQEDAQKLVAEGEAKGFEKGHAEGVEQGLIEGRKQGARQALEEAAVAYDLLATQWGQKLDELDQAVRGVQEQSADAVLSFAMAFAEKVTKRQIEVDEDAVLPQLEQALATVLRPVSVTVRANPQDRPLLDDAAPKLVQRFEQVEHLQLVDDDTIERGGCIVTYGRGQIDATIKTQMDRITGLVVGGLDDTEA